VWEARQPARRQPVASKVVILTDRLQSGVMGRTSRGIPDIPRPVVGLSFRQPPSCTTPKVSTGIDVGVST
jgi:hypothetical protein